MPCGSRYCCLATTKTIASASEWHHHIWHMELIARGQRNGRPDRAALLEEIARCPNALLWCHSPSSPCKRRKSSSRRSLGRATDVDSFREWILRGHFSSWLGLRWKLTPRL